MPEVQYAYSVTVGGYSWDGETSDPAGYGPVDGLQVVRKLVETDLWPAPADVAECRFQLIAPDAATLADLEVGLPVVVEYDDGTLPIVDPNVSFAGRVAEVTSQAHDLGVLYTLSCLDYNADLRQIDVGLVDYPAEDIQARIQRICDEAGLPVTFISAAQLVNVPPIAARTAEPAKLYDLLMTYTRQWPMQFEFIADIVTGPDACSFDYDGTTVTIRVVDTDPTYSAFLELENVGGLVTAVTPSTSTAVGMVQADEVDFSSSYAITKADAVNAVTVSGSKTGADASVTYSLGVEPVVTARVEDVELTDIADYHLLAQAYLPNDVPVVRWVADEFTWYLELGQDHATTCELPDLRGVVTVAGIDPDRNPTQRDWYTGQLVEYTFTLADKRPTYAFQLRRPDFTTAQGTSVLKWNSPALSSLSATWATLNPQDTWDDYRMVKGTT